MSNTQSAFEIMDKFPTEQAAREHLERASWNCNVTCPVCDSDNIYVRKGKRLGYYDCRDCKENFTVRTGSVMERSHIPLRKWLYPSTSCSLLARVSLPCSLARR